MMEERKYELKLKGFLIDNISFKANKFFKWNGPVTINPSFQRRITKLDNDNALVTLVFDVPSSNELPFALHVEINGSFELEKWESDSISMTLMKDNASSILFPYLRHAVSDITSISGIPPYIMPVQNVLNLFSGDKEQK